MYQLPFFYDDGAVPLGMGDFFREGIMAQKSMLLEFNYMVGVGVLINNDFVGSYPHIILSRIKV